MKPLSWCAIGLLLCSAALMTPSARGGPAEPKPRPKMEVVFTLDTTGSMSGLIEGAKRKIWSIVNQILSGKPTPEVKIGLVAYRDRGDEYITQITPLTPDVDAVYAALTELRANGGRDAPESVNQALHEAVTKIEWCKDNKDTLKIIYLVGDAPPHMDYSDDVKYPETCRLAVANSILINTLQCGAMEGTGEIWQEIARLAEGQYAAIPADGGAVAIATPFDEELARANAELTHGTLLYGPREQQAADRRKLDLYAGDGFGGTSKIRGPAGPSAEVAAARASAQAKAGRVAYYDFLDAVKEGRVNLKSVKEEELPEQLRKLSPQQREAKIRRLLAERQKLLQRIGKLGRKRDDYIASQQKKNKTPGDGFDEQVLGQLRSQAKRIGVKY
ncbi:MAG: VWA domain-containing protein [Armatimonadetes bacterium]|nr:VWA domain-containing protein [Armatimonadota bacterium]